MSENFKTERRFFAAANGITGFRSYFDEIFPSEELTGVFVLKGGPGTGKSTLLRDLSSAFASPDIQQDIFHCSSDPKSLDGLLLTLGERRIAILDGTAPHERDARIPGATDILVNLGEGFDLGALRAQREKILTLQKKKSISYKDAYFYLAIFGIFASKIMAETKERLKEGAIHLLENDSFFQKNAEAEGVFTKRPIGAFCKDGLQRLDTYEKICKQKFHIEGEDEEGKILLTALFSRLSKNGSFGYVSPSPLFSDLVDGLILKNGEVSITQKKTEGSKEIFSKDFFKKISPEAARRGEEYKAEAARYLSLAREALCRASESHFALEEIYTPAMHFERIDSIKADLKKEIAGLLRTREIS